MRILLLLDNRMPIFENKNRLETFLGKYDLLEYVIEIVSNNEYRTIKC